MYKFETTFGFICYLSIKLMALGPAGCGPRVQARVGQAGGLKDAPAQTLHP